MSNIYPPVPTPSIDFTDFTNLTVVAWGTDGMYGTYIVTSASESKRIEEIPIENGTGFEAVVILLNKGLDVDLEVVDDTSQSVPAIGTVVTLSSPYGANVPMLFLGDRSNQARKREGMRTLTFKSYNAIQGLH